MNVSEIRSLVSACSPEDLAKVGVKVIEDSYDEPSDDYRCVYRAKFEPHDVTKASLEINVLESKFGGPGFVEVGVDNFGRIARRLGKRTGQPDRWLGDWSLYEIGDLDFLLGEVSRGNTYVMTRTFGRWLCSAELLLPQSAYDSAPNLGVRHYTRKRATEAFLKRAPWLSRIDRYAPW